MNPAVGALLRGGVCRQIYLNVAVSGVLTGLVYGLMALGLSVIFGVVRVVNFAHGEMMTIAMYLAVVLFAAFELDPLLMMVPIAGGCSCSAMPCRPADQSVHQPARTQSVHAAGCGRAHHGQRAADHLRPGRAERADILLVRQLHDRPADRRRDQGLCRRRRLAVATALFAFFRFSRLGKAIRACADNYTGALVVGLDVNGSMR